MKLKRESKTEADQPPPKVIVRAYSVPEPQAGTFQEYDTKSKTLKQSKHRQSPVCLQQTAETGIKLQAFSHDDPQHHPHDQPSVLLTAQDIQITQNQAFLPCPSGNEMRQGHTQHDISPHTPQQAQAWPKVLSPSIHQRQQGQSNAPNPRPVHGQSEVFSRAHAMARSRMNKAKQHLQKHIEEVITIFSNRVISQEQARRKQVNLNMLHIKFIFTLTFTFFAQ